MTNNNNNNNGFKFLLKFYKWLFIIWAAIVLLIMPSVYLWELFDYYNEGLSFLCCLIYTVIYILVLRAIIKHKKAPTRQDKLLKYKAEIEKNKPILEQLDEKLQMQKKIAIGKTIFGEKFVLYKVEEELKALEMATNQRQVDEKNRQALEKLEAEKRKEYERIERIKKAENEKFNELNRYAQCFGIEKRITMLSYERDNLKKSLKKLKSQRWDAESALSDAKKAQRQQGRQGDWALRSGAATALFGPVVGAGVALQTIHDNNSNLEIKGMLMNGKIKNTQNKQEALNVILREITKLENQISDYERAIEETNQKLVADTHISNVFDSLKFTYKKASVSETGAITVTAFAELKKEINVFGEVPTVIDGTINAKLYQNGHLTGEAYMSLPKYGIGEKIKLEGMCLNRLNSDIPYEVQLEPYKLWYMEK